MTTPARRIYVISDLHMGGEPDRRDPNGRGFRMFTQSAPLAEFVLALSEKKHVEPVINGDFVDFLAEKLKGARHAFTADEKKACDAFDVERRPLRAGEIAASDGPVRKGSSIAQISSSAAPADNSRLKRVLDEVLGDEADGCVVGSQLNAYSWGKPI